MDTRRACSLWVKRRETIREDGPERSTWAPRVGRLMAANAAVARVGGSKARGGDESIGRRWADARGEVKEAAAGVGGRLRSIPISISA